MNDPAGVGWYVDERCTNCDVARQLAPGLIDEVDGLSMIVGQPRNDAEEKALHAAAHACHTRWLLPGHGDRQRLTARDMTRRLRNLAARTLELSPRPIDLTAVRW